MMVERYPNLKDKVGNSIPGCEIFSLLLKLARWSIAYYVVAAGLSTFCQKKKKKKGK
jgi:hypothetical protein